MRALASDLLYCADSVNRLLDRSERLEECECEGQCAIKTSGGSTIILGDTLEKFRKLLYAIENNPNASWPEGEDMDLLEMALKEGGAR
jgi:hypothetical protein